MFKLNQIIQNVIKLLSFMMNLYMLGTIVQCTLHFYIYIKYDKIVDLAFSSNRV